MTLGVGDLLLGGGDIGCSEGLLFHAGRNRGCRHVQPHQDHGPHAQQEKDSPYPFTVP